MARAGARKRVIVTHFALVLELSLGLALTALTCLGELSGPADAGPLIDCPEINPRGLGPYWAFAASVICWQTFSGVEAPRNRATGALLTAVPMAELVAWSR